MKDIRNFILEDKVEEFHYATEGDHDFIDEIVDFIKEYGFNESNKKVIKVNEYSLLHDGYELNIRVKSLGKSHPSTHTRLVVIRKGDTGNYDYYEKLSNDSHWHLVPNKKATMFNIHARNYQYTSNGFLDTNDEKLKERVLAHLRNVLHIKKK